MKLLKIFNLENKLGKICVRKRKKVDSNRIAIIEYLKKWLKQILKTMLKFILW